MTDQSCMDDALVKPVEGLKWSNSDNDAFYEGIKVDGLRAFAEKAGLARGCDMDILTPYWSRAESILEVGAGYGRVIKYLLEHARARKITAVERCEVFIEYLNKQYGKCSNVHLIPADVIQLKNLSDRFDLILVLWSAMADFSVQEQSVVIKILAKLLTKEGCLVIDIVPTNVAPLGSEKYSKQSYYLTLSGNSICGFLPTVQEIQDYAKEANLHNISHITYKTDTQRERWLFILNH